MSDPVLHIKDSFFFEVPKVLAPSNFQKREEFPDVWISLDPEFQDWEFKRLYDAGEIGEVRYAEGQYNHPMDIEHSLWYSPGTKHWRSWTPPCRSPSRRRSPAGSR